MKEPRLAMRVHTSRCMKVMVLLGTHEGPILTAICRAFGIDHDHRSKVQEEKGDEAKNIMYDCWISTIFWKPDW